MGFGCVYFREAIRGSQRATGDCGCSVFSLSGFVCVCVFRVVVCVAWGVPTHENCGVGRPMCVGGKMVADLKTAKDS